MAGIRLRDPQGQIGRMVDEGIMFLWREYQDTLGRVPDPEGLAAWLKGLLFAGLTTDQVHQAFLDSQEYRDRQPPIPPEPPKPPVRQRAGLVRADGRLWLDDEGQFFPLGGSLFWLLSVVRTDPGKVAKNLALFRDHRFDYVRILCEVAGGFWSQEPSRVIDPRWPDYRAVLAQGIDLAWDHGQRVELTLVGGGTPPLDGQAFDYMRLAEAVVDVVKDGRLHRVMNLEVTNENQLKDDQKLVQVLAYLRKQLPHLVAGTDATNGDHGLGEVGGTTWFFDRGANLGTLHLQRDSRKIERAIRPIRQSWDFRGFGKALSANEPIGPLSSVASDSDPMRLAFNRAVGILNGTGAWVLHNGAGVYGKVDPAHGRPADLWEVPGIDRIMAAVRGVDAWLPANLPNWQHFNHGWAGEPTTADSIWIDSQAGDRDHGVVRNYQARSGGRWLAFPLGIKDRVGLRVNQASEIQVIDLAGDGVIDQRTVGAGEVVQLKPHGRPTTDRDDPESWGCLLVSGRNV